MADIKYSKDFDEFLKNDIRIEKLKTSIAIHSMIENSTFVKLSNGVGKREIKDDYILNLCRLIHDRKTK